MQFILWFPVCVLPGVSPAIAQWQQLDNGIYNAVSFADRHSGWAVGPKGKIARFAPPPEK